MINQILKIALKTLWVNKGRSFLTMLGVIIGVTSVILLISIGDGLKKTIEQQLSNFGSDQIYVMPFTPGQNPGPPINRLEFADAEYIKSKVEEVEDTAAMVETFATLKSKNRLTKQVDLIGATASINKITDDTVLKGRFFSRSEEENGENVAVIGPTVATNLFLSGNPIGQKINILDQKFTVIGVLEEKGSMIGVDMDKRAYIPRAIHSRITGAKNPTTILVKIKSGQDTELTAKKISRAMAKIHQSDEFSVMTQEETVDTINQILGILQAGLSGIAAISLIVGGIGIMNIMLVSVAERTREIGLRKAVGAKPRHILSQFLIEAIVLSLAGGLVGIIFGELGGRAIHLALPSLEPHISVQTVILATAFSVAVGVIFGVLPAYRASRLDPIEALRYE